MNEDMWVELTLQLHSLLQQLLTVRRSFINVFNTFMDYNGALKRISGFWMCVYWIYSLFIIIIRWQ